MRNSLPLRRPAARLLALAGVAAALAAASPLARATVYTWSDPYGSAFNWYYGGNWVGGLFPPSSVTTELAFSSDADGLVNNDYATYNGGADYRLLNLSLGALPSRAWTMTGSRLRFASGGTLRSDAAYGIVNSIANDLRLDGALNLNVASGSLTLTGVLSDAPAGGGTTYTGSLVKTGTGTLTLSGPNAYSGGTTVSGGILKAGSDAALGSGQGDLTVAGGCVDLDGRALQSRNLTLGGYLPLYSSEARTGVLYGGTLTVDGNIAYRGPSDDQGLPTVVGANLSLTSGQHALGDNGHYTPYHGGNVYGDSPMDLVLNGKLTGPGGIDKAGAFDLALTAQSDYQGATNVNAGRIVVYATDALPTHTDLTVASGASVALQAGAFNVGFNWGVFSGAYSQTVGSLAGAGSLFVGRATLTVDGSKSTTFSGTIGAWDGGLVKKGTGELTLSGTTNFVSTSYGIGGIKIQGGKIVVGNDGSLGGGDLALLGGSLSLNGFSPTVKDLSLGDDTTSGYSGVTGAGTLRLTGDLAFSPYFVLSSTPSPAFRVDADLSLSAGQHGFSSAGHGLGFYDEVFSGTLSGAGGIDKTGPALLAFTGHNTYAGATNLNQGHVALGVTNALPASTALTVASGARLYLSPPFSADGLTAGSYSQTVGSLAGSGGIWLGSATLTVGDANSTTFSGVIQDNDGQLAAGSGGKLVKQGSGTLTLSGGGGYTGGTLVKAGTIQLGATNALPTSGPVALSAAGTLALGGYDATIGALTGTGTANLGANRLSVGGDGTSFAFSGKLAGSGVLAKAGGGRADLTGASFSGFSGSLEVDGGSLVTTTAYKGPVTLNGGTIEIAQNFAGTLSNSIAGDGSFLKSGTGVIKVGDGDFTGTTAVSGGGLTFLAGSTFVSHDGFSVASGATVTLGSFDTVLSGATYDNAGLLRGTGQVDAAFGNLPGGRVSLGNADSLAVGSSSSSNGNLGVIAANGGALTVLGDFGNSGTLSATGGVIEVMGRAENAGLISGHGSFAFDGGLRLSGSGSLAASGGATDVFGSVAIGSATIHAGSVYSSGGGVLTFHSDTVNNAQTFQTGAGSATVFLGKVSGAGSFTGSGRVEFDGGYSPGNSPASVTVQGDLALGATNDLTMELGGTALGTGYDHLTVLGTASLGGALDVVGYGGFSASLGQSFDLFDFHSSTGTFASVQLPTLAPGLLWDTSALYATGVIRVVPQAVPEPAAFVALGLGALALARRQRR